MPHNQPADDKPLSIEEARGKIAKAMNDLVAGDHSGPMSFRLKPTKKPCETYLLKLTWHQLAAIRDSKHQLMENLKFSECLSPEIAVDVFVSRFDDRVGVTQAVGERRRVIAHKD